MSVIRYTAVGACSVLLWGAILPLVRLACEEQGILATLMVAQGVAGTLGTTFVLCRGRLPNSRDVYLSSPFLLRLALFVSHVMLVYTAVHVVDRTSMPGVLFCNYLWPTLVLVYCISLANVRVTRLFLFSLGILTALAALLVEFGLYAFCTRLTTNDLIAYLLAFLAANAWGMYSAVTRRHGDASGGSSVVPLFLLVCGMIGYLLSHCTMLPGHADLPVGISFAAIGVGVCNFVAYMCWDVGVRKGDLVTLSLIADCIPWLALISVAWILGVSVEAHTIFSAMLLVVGGVMARVGAMARRVRF